MKATLNKMWERFVRFLDIQQYPADYQEPQGLGIARIWKLPNTHPFFRAGVWHDRQYDISTDATSEGIDLSFYRMCVVAAAQQDSAAAINFYLAEAATFYAICRAWGELKWKPNQDPSERRPSAPVMLEAQRKL